MSTRYSFGEAGDARPLFLLFVAGGWGAIVLLNCVLLPPRLSPRVVVEKTALAPLKILVRASGNLDPKDSDTVKSQFDASVDQKRFREGQTVKKGQLLAVLGRDKIQIDYDTKKDSLENAQSDLSKARREVRLQRALFQKQAVARSAVEDAERAVVKAEQALRTAQQTFHDMQVEWDSARVLSPIDGTVVKDWLVDDKTVAAGKEIVTVADVSEFYVHARVDELEIQRVHEDQTAEVRLPVFDNTALPAEVTEIGTAPDGTTGLMAVPVVLRITDTKGLLLRPKLTAETTINTGQLDSVLSVPNDAISNADGQTRVWTLDSLHRLRAQNVTVGQSNPDRVEIKQGLHPGMWIVKSAEPQFYPGLHVMIAHGSDAPIGSRTHAILAQHDAATKKSHADNPTPDGDSGEP